MTSSDRTPATPPAEARLPGTIAAVTGLLSVIAIVLLAFTGHGDASLIAGVAGGAVTGGRQLTVIIRR
ncbi:hypothetical protein HZZ00_19225 [Streptomyces sp. NEAU-sy36]|uniref:hypothetical protein n=1 Tax=unclassified Streptomyces TaxID=2593676 RepID=UPI0015D637B3|nr:MULTISPECIES: hypothetical protein [unclassified Streptomyces]QLJ02923.1 hypothetical protein HZZ00_19225 [Streptomyces sp. NEAU-sy36]